MIRKKMIEVKVFTIDGREEKVRIFNILGTDLYYVSGEVFDAKYSKYCGGVHFAVPYRWTVDDEGKYHQITDVPDYVRRIYRMNDGQIEDVVLYDNSVPFRWTRDDDGNYYPIIDIPDYVRNRRYCINEESD